MSKASRNRSSLAVFLAIALVCTARVAQAHKINLFATAEGRKISGRAYFSRGEGAQNVKVEVTGPKGEKLAELRTDKEGKFEFTARFRCDHKFVVTTIDGHKASYTVTADELPEVLPPLGDAAPTPVAAPAPKIPAPAPPPDVEAMVERAVSRQIAPLRRDIKAYQEKVRIHDVLGGLGYIFGLCGVAFYFLGTARKKAAQDPQ